MQQGETATCQMNSKPSLNSRRREEKVTQLLKVTVQWHEEEIECISSFTFLFLLHSFDCYLGYCCSTLVSLSSMNQWTSMPMQAVQCVWGNGLNWVDTSHFSRTISIRRDECVRCRCIRANQRKRIWDDLCMFCMSRGKLVCRCWKVFGFCPLAKCTDWLRSDAKTFGWFLF